MQPPTFREIIALLKHDGFVKVAQVGRKVAQVGSHAKYVSGDRAVTVNGSGGDRPKKGTWASIRRQAGW